MIENIWKQDSLQYHPEITDECECLERERLVRAYHAFVSDYERAMQVLRARIGVMPMATYQRIRDGAQQVRQRREQAKAELDAHLAEHRCDNPFPAVERSNGTAA